nr:MAG TPA: hypothetical protein [Caudoviricetes sp.]
MITFVFFRVGDRFFGKLHQTHIKVTDNLLPLFVQPFL